MMKELLVLGVASVLLLVIGILGIQSLNFAIDSRVVSVTIGGKPYYRGPAPCVEVASVGAASQVSISRGFLCLLPDRFYVGNDVKIETVEKK